MVTMKSLTYVYDSSFKQAKKNLQLSLSGRLQIITKILEQTAAEF